MRLIDFGQFPIWVNLAIFVLLATGIWISGTKLTIYADELSDRRKLSKALIGLILLAGVTELPELVTTITAAVENNASLVLNNMFGGIVLQTAILAIADLVNRGAPLTYYPRKPTAILEGALLTLLLAILLTIVALGEQPLYFAIGIGSLISATAYFIAIGLLRHHDEKGAWVPVQIADKPKRAGAYSTLAWVKKISEATLYKGMALGAAMILILGALMVLLAETLAVQTGLGSSFIGVTLLATATSLPELSTTIMAIRLGAYTMAISNIFGSNLIMIVLILPADLFYRPGPILATVDKSAVYALSVGLVVTAIYLIGLVMRSRRKMLGMGYDSLSVLIVYGLSLFALYGLR